MFVPVYLFPHFPVSCVCMYVLSRRVGGTCNFSCFAEYMPDGYTRKDGSIDYVRYYNKKYGHEAGSKRDQDDEARPATPPLSGMIPALRTQSALGDFLSPVLIVIHCCSLSVLVRLYSQ